jgi:acid phosphatase
MPIAEQARRNDGMRPRGRLRSALVRSASVAALLVCVQAGALAADCPPLREPRIPPIPGPADPVDPVNINKVKAQLNQYQTGNYDYDIGAVLADAHIYVEHRAGQVTMPAVVLDIDETSLSNWPNIKADDFGFINDIKCNVDATLPCGFNDWIATANAPAIVPTLDFFNATVAKGVAVFFITARLESQRAKTVENLEKAKFKGWTRLLMLPDADKGKPVSVYKSGERAKIEKEGYTIIANVGDQRSDLAGDSDGDHAECKFKVPNPFYFIP